MLCSIDKARSQSYQKPKVLMLHQSYYFIVSVKLNFVRDGLIELMIKINFNPSRILAMYSLNFKQLGRSSYQFASIYGNIKEQYFKSIQNTS